MAVYIPCLSVEQPDTGGGFSVGVGAGPISGGDGGGGVAIGVSISHSDSPVAVTIYPAPPFVFFGPNWKFWSNLFGLGETRIERQKQQIQDVYTSIFRYLHKGFGVPLRDNHALQFQSDGVEAQLRRRPDIAALVPSLLDSAEIVATAVFADNSPGSGKRERVVNQFVANAAINDWPVHATRQIWDGIVEAARSDCSADASRWMRNPVVIEAAAKWAIILQYIPLSTLSAAVSIGGISDQAGSAIIQHWAQNPQLVTVPLVPERPDWAVPFRLNVLPEIGHLAVDTETTLIDDRPQVLEIFRGVSFQRPTYPDFLAAPQGGLPSPRPQPAPEIPPVDQPPQPPPAPQTEIIPPAQHDGAPTRVDLDFACWVWGEIRAGRRFSSAIQLWVDSPIGQAAMARQQDNPLCFSSGQGVPAVPIPQPPAPPPDQPGPVLEIPNQTDLDRACQIYKRVKSGATMTGAELEWINSPLGTRAWYIVKDRPECQPVQQPPNPYPQDPTCPPWQPPTPRPMPQPPPTPIPQPPPTPQPRDGHCDPDCQWQIDLLRQRQQECCDQTQLNVIPRIENLERWVWDIERRLPGPQPPLPNPQPLPPFRPAPPPNPPDDIDNDGTPDVEEPPPLPPDVVECLIKFCDPEERRKERREDERELECVRVPLCDPQGGPWGAMAECWHDKNQTPQRDVYGVYRQAQIPATVVALYQRSYQQSFSISGQQSGPSQSQTFDPRDPARWDTISDKLAQQYLSDYKAGAVTMQRTSAVIPSRPWIFADPDQPGLGQVKMRQPKLRPGEADPCSVEPSQVLEIPPISN